MVPQTDQDQPPLLCSTGCGFYGSPRNNGMCSVCYKNFLQRQSSREHVSPPGSSDSSTGGSLIAQCSDSTTVSSPAATPPADAQPGHCSDTTASATSEEENASGTRSSPTPEHSQTSGSGASAASPVQEEKPKAKNRCFICRKKVGLIGFDCRCGNTFCSVHRYSDVHNCTYDYKADAAERIRKENPVVAGKKIHKI